MRRGCGDPARGQTGSWVLRRSRHSAHGQLARNSTKPSRTTRPSAQVIVTASSRSTSILVGSDGSTLGLGPGPFGRASVTARSYGRAALARSGLSFSQRDPRRKGREVKRLYLLRHAKSSWDDPNLSDRDRPLAPRGRRAATRIGRHLRQVGIQPEEVLCSTAKRARQTLESVLPFLDPDVSIHTEDEIYRADSDQLLQRLRRVSPTVGSVMLIGHNPSIQELALTLVGDGDGMMARLAEKFPTAGLAAFTVGSDEWSGLARGQAHLDRFLIPRDLS